MRHLEKSYSRRRWEELRELVNAWDPIGAIALGFSQTEYEDLVNPIMRLLERGASEREISNYLKSEASTHYGISFTGIGAIAHQIREWYDDQWPDTVV